MVSHGASEIVLIEGRGLDVWEICKQVVKRAFAAKCRWQDIGVLESVPAEEGRQGIVEALVNVVDCLASSDIAHLKINLLFAVLPVPWVEGPLEYSFQDEENRSHH